MGSRPLLGIVDLVFQSDDRLVVRDYKTAGRKWNQGNAESNAGQLELYGELVKKLVPDRELSFEFIVLTKTKSPAVERFTVESSRRRIERTKLIANITLDAIATGVFYSNKNPMTCATCPYPKGLCCMEGITNYRKEKLNLSARSQLNLFWSYVAFGVSTFAALLTCLLYTSPSPRD